MIKLILPVLLIVVGIFVSTNLVQTRQLLNSFANNFDQKYSVVSPPIDPTEINVRNFGAKGDGYVDDTDAFNAAIRTAKADPRLIKKIYIPNGFYIIKSLDLTNISIKIEGESMASTRLMASNQDKSLPVLDLTGAQYTEIENLTIIGGGTGFDGKSNEIKPSIGILMAGQKDNAPGATKFLIKDVMVRGEFNTASVYIYGTCCNSYINLYIDSYLDGVPGLVVTGTNRLGVTSSYTEIATGLQDTVDLNFIEAEVHDLSNVGFDGKRVSKGESKAVLIDNVRSLGFVGGVFSSCGGTSIVELLGKNQQVVFDKATFASAEGNCPKAPLNTFYVDGKMDGLSLRNPNIDGGGSQAVIAGSDNSYFNGLVIEGSIKSANRFNKDARLILIQGHKDTSINTPVINNSRIMADGLNISPGGSITNTHIIDPGIIALNGGGIDNSTKSQ